jgi:trans-aconitate methyltransferase
MSEPINLYGDKLVPTSGHHGADIALQRVDDLDRECLIFAAQNACQSGKAVDIGCGSGSFGIRLAALGHKVCLYDVLEKSSLLERASTLFPFIQIKYYQCDVRKLTADSIDVDTDIFYSQRTIHYLRYQEAITLLKLFRKNMASSGRLFISASGIDSELGNKYLRIEINNRFDYISNEMQSKHQIHERVCLYSKSDMVQLCEYTVFSVIDVWLSSFGNVKIICGV